MRLVRAIAIAALLVSLLPAAAFATDQGASLKYGGGGLGTVIFDGRLHTGKGYLCKDCHNDLFLTKKQARVSMSAHFTDKLCFKCHDNKEASKDCVTCHRKVRGSGMVASDFMRSAMADPPANEAERDILLSGKSGVSAQTRACLSCHGDPKLAPVTERGKSLNLLVDRPAYGVGAHGVLPCAACHYGTEGAASFTKRPHALAPAAGIDCKSCHAQRLVKEVKAFDASLHSQKTEGKFTCVSCHDAHSQSQNGKPPLYKAAVEYYNRACLDCHNNPEAFAKLSSTPLDLKAMEHSFMAKFEEHKASVLCIDCHSPMGSGMAAWKKAKQLRSKRPPWEDIPPVMGADPHRNLEKAKALRDCASCHSAMDSLIVARVVQRDGNADSLSGKYIPGQKDSASQNRVFGWAFAALIAALFLHGAARLVGKKHAATGEVVSTFVYPLPIRVFHWINALCFLLMIWTGAGIHFAGLSFTPGLEQAVSLHSYLAYLVIANFVVFLLYSIASGEIRQYLPGKTSCSLADQARYYLSGIFTGAKKPFAVSRERRFNPLQQLTYLVVFILGMPLLILSGVLLLLPESATAGLAARDTLATVHFCIAACYALFLLAHLYLTTTGDGVFSLIKGMITGYHEEKK